MIEALPLPQAGTTYLFEGYFVRVVGVQEHARGWQVITQPVGIERTQPAGLSEFMRFAQPQPRY